MVLFDLIMVLNLFCVISADFVYFRNFFLQNREKARQSPFIGCSGAELIVVLCIYPDAILDN